MANEKTIKGRNSILFIYAPLLDEEGDAVAAAYFPVACLTTNDISFSNSIEEGSITKCNLTPEPSYGAESYQITFEAENIENTGVQASFDAVYKARKASVANGSYVYFKIVTTLSDSTTSTVFGKGLIPELSKSSPVEGAETFSGTIQGVGDLSDTDLHV